MPPRSANRKAKSKKLTSKSKQPAVESTTLTDEGVTVSEFDNKDQELAQSLDDDVAQQEDESVVEKVEGHDEVNEMKQEIEAPNGNCGVSVEVLPCEGEDRVAASSGGEVRVKEEVVGERSTEVVMEKNLNVNVNVNSEGAVENENGNDKNDDANMEDVEEKGDNATEKLIEGGVVSNGGSEPVAELNSYEENVAAEINDTEAHGENNNLLVVEEGSNQKGEGEESGDDEESEEDSEDDKDPLIEGKNENNLEIFIGGLDKRAVEDDLIEVFGKFGEIKAARIVRKSTSKKSKGFAFIQYATVEQTKNALSELKEGIEVRGKHVRVSTSQDKDTLYMGNICKTWTKERVLETLKDYGIEDIVDVQLPYDPKNESKTKGFVLLKFSNHSNALEAHRRLSMPDAVFGCDRSAKVAFRNSRTPKEEDLSQVKRVYIEGLAGGWNEEKLKEICKQYGEIIEVMLVRGQGKKRKDIGFVSFTSRESALACVEGIDNAEIGEGKVKVKASIAKPHNNRRPQKQGFSGGFVVQEKSVTPSKREGEKAKQTESSKMKGNSNSKWAKRNGKAVMVEENRKSLSESRTVHGRGGKKPNRPQRGTESQTVGETSKVETRNHKRKDRPSKGESHWKGREEHDYSKRPLKRPRDNVRGRQSNNFRNPKRDDRVRKDRAYTASTAYHARGAISASKRHSTDMEPHAGFLQPVAGKQVHPYSGYLEATVGSQIQHHAGYRDAPAGIQSQPYATYHEPAYGTQGRPHGIYREPTAWTQGQTHSGYLEPAVVRHVQPHPGYPQPAVVKHVQEPYDPRFRRDDGQGSSGSAYVAGSALPPYVANYTSYPGYEGHGGASAGGYYQSNGAAHVPRRAYY